MLYAWGRKHGAGRGFLIYLDFGLGGFAELKLGAGDKVPRRGVAFVAVGR